LEEENSMATLEYELIRNGTIISSRLNPALGHVRGRVTDIHGNGLKRSTVWIGENGISTCVDEDGNFVLINILPGKYTLVAESEEYPRTMLTNVPIEPGDNPGRLFVMYSRNSGQDFESRHGVAESIPSEVPFPV
jgi:hypothetical protein